MGREGQEDDVRERRLLLRAARCLADVWKRVDPLQGPPWQLPRISTGCRWRAAGYSPRLDSRQVITKDGSSVIHVVKETPQILPYCVIQLKNDSISSEYRKPGPTPSVSCARFTTTTTTTPTTATVIKADPPSTLSKEVRVEKTLKAFTRPIPPKLTMRIALCQSTGNARVATQEESVCPVCLEPLETGVVALPCSHKLHEDCARKV